MKALPWRVYLKKFFVARVARIFPLYFLAIALGHLTFTCLAWPEEWPRILPFLSTFTFNLYPIITGDELPYVFCHFWSLATEEQFYLIWPFLVLFIPKRFLSPVALGLLVIAPACRLLLGEMLRHKLPEELVSRSIYYFPLCHIDALGLGILLAMGTHDTAASILRSKVIHRFLMILLCGLLCAHIATTIHWGSIGISRALAIDYPERLYRTFHHVFTMSITATGSALLLSSALRRESWAIRIFESKPLARLGVISYGVYVFHLPLLEAFRHFTDIQPRTLAGLLFFPIYIIASVILAELSFRFLEEPISRWAKRR